MKDLNKTISSDKRMVMDPNAEPTWARFYEIDTNRPFFCNRDGIKVRDLPGPLQQIMLDLQIGQSTPPYGSLEDGVRVFVELGPRAACSRCNRRRTRRARSCS